MFTNIKYYLLGKKAQTVQNQIRMLLKRPSSVQGLHTIIVSQNKKDGNGIKRALNESFLTSPCIHCEFCMKPSNGSQYSFQHFVYSRYRILTINNVFFERNKIAEGGIRNTATGDSVDVSCFYSHIEPCWIQFSSVIVQALLVHASFV